MIHRAVLFIVGGIVIFGLGINFGLSFIATNNNEARNQQHDASPLLASGKLATSSSSRSYQKAFDESLQFFNDVEEQDWERMKRKVRDIQPNTKGNPRRGRRGTHAWFQNHYEPDFACRHERRIGRLGDGGKWVCDPHRLKIQEVVDDGSAVVVAADQPCLVYSVGSNGDNSFEAAVKKDIGNHCEIHTFDFSDYTEKVESVGAIFHQWGLGDSTENKIMNLTKMGKTTETGLQFKTLADTVKLLGHEGRVIDIFKIDCEGCEWSTAHSWFEANVTIRQVQVELHEDTSEGGKAEGGGIVPRPAGTDFFKMMYQQGYVIFHKEPNIEYWNFERCVEYAFLLLDQSFFLDNDGNSWLK